MKAARQPKTAAMTPPMSDRATAPSGLAAGGTRRRGGASRLVVVGQQAGVHGLVHRPGPARRRTGRRRGATRADGARTPVRTRHDAPRRRRRSPTSRTRLKRSARTPTGTTSMMTSAPTMAPGVISPSSDEVEGVADLGAEDAERDLVELVDEVEAEQHEQRARRLAAGDRARARLRVTGSSSGHATASVVLERSSTSRRGVARRSASSSSRASTTRGRRRGSARGCRARSATQRRNGRACGRRPRPTRRAGTAAGQQADARRSRSISLDVAQAGQEREAHARRRAPSTAPGAT